MSVLSLIILNGPGLDELRYRDAGSAEPLTLGDIEQACAKLCVDLDVELSFRESDVASELINWIEDGARGCDALVINPLGCPSNAADDGFDAYRTAIKSLGRLDKPVIEVHLTNIFQGDRMIEPLREPGAQLGLISGLGLDGYLLAIESLVQRAGTKGAGV